jgi:hypothetical protein
MAEAAALSREVIETALERGKAWLLRNQITPETRFYDTYEEPAEAGKTGRWTDAPLPEHLVGGFYANLWRNPAGARRPEEVRRQYHSTWHTAQCGVALMRYLEYREDAAARQAVELTWDFMQRHQVAEGEFAGVFVERAIKDLRFPLREHLSFSQQNAKADDGYAAYDNIETDLFPLELHRTTGNVQALRMARANAEFYLNHHPDRVFLEVETHKPAINGMANDAIYGRLAKYTGERKFYDVYARQVRRMNLNGLDLRAGNNIRNMYWDMTGLIFGVEEFPELRGPAMAQLAFLAEHLRCGQREEGVLWFRFKAPGVPDAECHQSIDGAATGGALAGWAAMYDATGDPRWMECLRKAVGYAVRHQYPDNDHAGFAGAFKYAGWIEPEGRRYEMLRGVATAFTVRALVELLEGRKRWAREYWQ